jgi:hypothetical protein
MAGFNIQLQPGDVQTDLFTGQNNNPQGILFPGNSLYSPQQAFRCLFQESDGDVLIQGVEDSELPRIAWTNIWSLRGDLDQQPIATGPANQVARLTMQFDGNLVRYDAAGTVKWASGTQGNQQAFLRMQDDGNLVIYTTDGRPIWATNTNAGPSGRPKAGPR